MGISAAGSWEETLVLLQYMSKVKAGCDSLKKPL